MTEGDESLSVPYGSYHQLYRIDGRLVAVGVVDILPTCLVSSVGSPSKPRARMPQPAMSNQGWVGVWGEKLRGGMPSDCRGTVVPKTKSLPEKND